LGGVGGSVITNIWTGKREKAKLASEERRDGRRLESEERRWKTDRLLIREIDSLIDLHVALVECHTNFNTYLMFPRTLTANILANTLRPKRDAFMGRKAIAQIYLTKDEREMFNALVGQYDLALEALEKGLGTGKHQMDDSKLIELVDQAESVIRERLRPGLQGLR
jgi:hypothetical protein